MEAFVTSSNLTRRLPSAPTCSKQRDGIPLFFLF